MSIHPQHAIKILVQPLDPSLLQKNLDSILNPSKKKKKNKKKQPAILENVSLKDHLDPRIKKALDNKNFDEAMELAVMMAEGGNLQFDEDILAQEAEEAKEA